MTRPRRNGVDFLKIITAVLAMIFGVSLGLCGLSSLAPGRSLASSTLFSIELTAMALSLAGMILLIPVWIITGLIHGRSSPQRRFEDKDKERDKK